jgi:SpoVK/Ycf46/Vps4 family AAA+-type ATPase
LVEPVKRPKVQISRSFACFAGYSHDRYANMEINYLVERMENYAGLAILAMNRRRNLDASFLRRFRFVVEFPSPSPRKKRTAKS